MGRRRRGATLDWGFPFHPSEVFSMACPCSWSRRGGCLSHPLSLIPRETHPGDSTAPPGCHHSPAVKPLGHVPL